MVARNENNDRTPENFLTLLLKVGECGGGGGESRVYRCKTCMKEFSSHQALGGHRASHRKPVNNSSEDQTSSSSGSLTTENTKKTKSHTCPICRMEFPLGQALGGHMRKHRKEKESDGALVTRSLFPEATIWTTLKKPSSGKRVACLDSVESRINLKLELGRTIY